MQLLLRGGQYPRFRASLCRADIIMGVSMVVSPRKFSFGTCRYSFVT